MLPGCCQCCRGVDNVTGDVARDVANVARDVANVDCVGDNVDRIVTNVAWGCC